MRGIIGGLLLRMGSERRLGWAGDGDKDVVVFLAQAGSIWGPV